MIVAFLYSLCIAEVMGIVVFLGQALQTLNKVKAYILVYSNKVNAYVHAYGIDILTKRKFLEHTDQFCLKVIVRPDFISD